MWKKTPKQKPKQTPYLLGWSSHLGFILQDVTLGQSFPLCYGGGGHYSPQINSAVIWRLLHKGHLVELTAAWALASAPDLPMWAMPRGAAPGPALLQGSPGKEGGNGQKWPLLPPSLISAGEPGYQQGLVPSGLRLFISSAIEAVSVGAHCCSKKDVDSLADGREPQPGSPSVHASGQGGSWVSQHILNFTSEVFWQQAH